MKITTEQDLAEAIRGANAPLRVTGGGTRDIGHPVVGEELAVACSGVELYEPGALTLVVRAGTTLREIEALLAGEGQRLAFEPMDHRVLLGTEGQSTIGGVVAANVSGPRRIQAGAARDFTLGARFVDGAGRVIRNGGRVMKNVTGYDLVKLMAGSWGTLGVLSEVSFKVLAVPEMQATLVGHGLSLGDGVAALSRALGSPYDVTGVAHAGPGVLADEALTCVRLEGFETAVRYRAGALQAAGFEAFSLVEGEKSAALWAQVRDVAPFADAPVVWRISLKPGAAPALSTALAAQGLDHRLLCDWGGGLVWLAPTVPGEDGGAALIRGALAAPGGHATLVKAPLALRAAVPVFQPEPAPLARISRALRAQFDPKGLLNPGLMGA